jgi:hypothetical protein
MEATKTIYQDDLVTAQGVKTLGRRNAKPTANREVEEDYIQQPRSPPIENEAGGCGHQRGIAGMGVQRKQQANVRAICGIYRGTEGLEGVLILFWTDFWAVLLGNTPFPFVFTVSCVWAGVRITLASAGGSACIAITPLVRLQQVNRVLID